MKLTKYALAFGLTLCASAPAWAKIDKCDQNTRLDTHATVSKGVDGDTIHVDIGDSTYSVRMLGMDTQETHFLGKSQGKWGDEAAATMMQLAPLGSAVTLEYGVNGCDEHGRLLAQVFLGKTHLNAEMVKRGLAVNYCVAPDFNYCDEFSTYTQNAIDQKLGMFSDANFELPYDFRRRIENAPQRSYVGNIKTKEVLGPGHQNNVPIADRVFFFTPDTVVAPYHIVDQEQYPSSL